MLKWKPKITNITIVYIKYNDYYFSTGRYNYPIAKSIEEALEITPAPLPDLENMRKKLMRAFPADLWE